MEIEFTSDWDTSSMKLLFPELRGTERQLKLFPITERHLEGATPDSNADADQECASE